MSRPSPLTPGQRAFVAGARRATLATTAPDGRPRLVPVCFVLGDAVDPLGRALLYTPLDEKPKESGEPRGLARVRDLLVLPQATLLVDRWDENWTRLAWVRLYGTGELLEPEPREREEHARAVEHLRAKYPQYGSHALDGRPIIRIAVDRVVAWGRLEDPEEHADEPHPPGADALTVRTAAAVGPTPGLDAPSPEPAHSSADTPAGR